MYSVFLLLSIYHVAELHIPNTKLMTATNIITLLDLVATLNTFLLYPIVLSDQYSMRIKSFVKNYFFLIVCVSLYAALTGLGGVFRPLLYQDILQGDVFSQITNVTTFIITIISVCIPIAIFVYSIIIKVPRHYIYYLILIQFIPITVIGNLLVGDTINYGLLSFANLGHFVLIIWIISNNLPDNNLSELEDDQNIAVEKRDTSNSDYLKWLEIEKYILSNKIWRNNNLSLDSLALELRINRSKLSYIFNTYSGESFQNFIAELRIRDFIKTYNKKSNKNPEYFFEKVGFKSKSTGYGHFKRIMKVSPGVYFERLNKEA